MQQSTQALMAVKLPDFGQLQARYQSMKLAQRAGAILEDAGAALGAAERILKMLAADPHSKQAFANLRGNVLITGKMRAADAKITLMDESNDFIAATARKLAAWRKTMERISSGESIAIDKGKEYIPASAPLALAIAGNSGISNYLSVVQLALAELAKLDAKNAPRLTSTVAEIRRCATLLGDYEHASGIAGAVH